MTRPSYVGQIGTRQRDLETLLRLLQSDAAHLVLAYEAGLYGYGLHRYLTAWESMSITRSCRHSMSRRLAP